MDAMNDDQLLAILADIRAGNTEAYSALVTQYQTSVRSYVAMLGVEPAEVDEVAQQAFVTAFHHLHRFKDGQPFGPWVRGIARNMAQRFFVARKRSRTVALDTTLAELSNEEPTTPDVDIKDHLPALKDCIEALP